MTIKYLHHTFYPCSNEVRIGLGLPVRYAFEREGKVETARTYYTWREKEDKEWLAGSAEVCVSEFERLYD